MFSKDISEAKADKGAEYRNQKFFLSIWTWCVGPCKQIQYFFIAVLSWNEQKPMYSSVLTICIWLIAFFTHHCRAHDHHHSNDESGITSVFLGPCLSWLHGWDSGTRTNFLCTLHTGVSAILIFCYIICASVLFWFFACSSFSRLSSRSVTILLCDYWASTNCVLGWTGSSGCMWGAWLLQSWCF